MPIPDPAAETTLFSRLHALKEETDFEFVLELIEIYLNETPAQIQAVAAAISNLDAPGLAHVAHKLKGSSMNIGAVQIGQICLKLEEIGRSGRPIPGNIDTKELETEFEQIKVLMFRFKQNG